ncbi:MAG: TetR/AcrR family transcriptional regulator [Bacteroidales bacterium]|nr:TetR/AcrR family transcriptional regulator [Bacteroidales bacterium]
MINSNKKYNDIVKTARDLFWKHGFKRVSIEEICQKAHVSKMTYYKHFRDKVELAKTIFNDVVEEGERKFRHIMKEDTPAAEKIKNIILLKMESTNDISHEFLRDFYTEKESELQAYVEERTRKAWNLLIEDFKEAQKAGIIRKDFKIEFLIKVQNKLVDLLEDESLTGMYDSQQELILELTNLIVYGIVPHD